MQNLHQRGKRGVWYVKKDVPADVRPAFGGKVQVWKSLGTLDKFTAAKLAVPILADLDRQIAEARGKPVVAEASKRSPEKPSRIGARIDPDDAFAAIDRWRRAAMKEAQVEHFSGSAEVPSPFGQEALRWSALVHALQERRTGDIDGFDEKLVAALREQGLPVTAAHPAIPKLRVAFAASWEELERYVGRLREGDFTSPIEEDEPEQLVVTSPVPKPSGPPAMRLDDLLERFVARYEPQTESAIRGYVRRLKEHLGDPELTAIDAPALDRFLIQLRKFPNTKRPDVNRLTFDQVIARYEKKPDVPRLAQKTVWKWFAAYNRLFTYAEQLGFVSRNPVTGARPKLKFGDRGERLAYDAADIEAIFSKPLFTGAVMRRDRRGKLTGYREQPGGEVLKDACFWLPILALWHGFRLEEIGAAKLDDVRQDDDLWFVDLTQRSLKTRQSKRQVPLHPRVVDLGFLRYVADLRRAEADYLFPELPHDPDGDLSSTRKFSKWWGFWCEANAGELGASGFNDPDKSFHSFRHTFKRACRNAGIAEEIHDLLTGHKSLSIGRSYGQGASLKTLSDALSRVEYPTFPAGVGGAG